MKSIISFMKRGYDRRQACEKANVEYKLFLQWYNEGSKNCDKEKRNFWKQVIKIESNEKQNVKYFSYDSSKDKKFDTDENKENIPSNSFIPVTSIPNIQPYSINQPEPAKNQPIFKPENIPEEMKKIILFMENGNSRNLAARNAGVSIEQVLRWYGQGSKDYSPETAYFYQQLSKIEQENKKPSKTYNFIPKNKQKNIV